MKTADINLANIFETSYFEDLFELKGYRTKVSFVGAKENKITFRFECSSKKKEIIIFLLKIFGLSLPITKEKKRYGFSFRIIYICNRVDCINSIILEAASVDCSTLPENRYHQLYSNLLTRNVRFLLKKHGVRGVIIPNLNLSLTTMIQFDDTYGDFIGKLNLIRPVVFKKINPNFGFMFIAS